jgi:acyl-CoA oxidase
MLNLRIGIHYTVHYTIAKMATIGSRYSFLRRQFDPKEGNGNPETLVMQYQMQQVKIVPAIAAAWAHLITNISMTQQYEAYKVELAKKSKKSIDMLQELHCLAAGLKPMGTWHGEYFGEFLKQSCGGHGYL